MKRIVLAAAIVISAQAPALAHHGWSSYDETKPVTLSGTFTDLQWGNPHGMAQMRWQGKLWTVVLAPVGRMESRGLTRAEIAPGRRVTLTGYLKRDGSTEMRIERIKIGDKTVELR